MKKLLLVSMTAVLALVGCGGGNGKLGKKGAAAALFQASQPANKTGGGLLDLLGSAVDVNTTSTVNGKSGGTAKVTQTISAEGFGGTGSADIKSSIVYTDYSEDGVNKYNGTMTVVLKASSSETAAKVQMTTKGKITITGEVDDFIDADTSLDVSATGMSSTSGTASVTLNGNITTSSGVYTYTAESIDVDAGGELPLDE